VKVRGNTEIRSPKDCRMIKKMAKRSHTDREKCSKDKIVERKRTMRWKPGKRPRKDQRKTVERSRRGQREVSQLRLWEFAHHPVGTGGSIFSLTKFFEIHSSFFKVSTQIKFYEKSMLYISLMRSWGNAWYFIFYILAGLQELVRN
jgi:hypothetical protein